MESFFSKNFAETDEQAFIAYLYEKYMPWMRMRIHRYVYDLSLCEDLAVDCFDNLMLYLDKLKSLSESELRSYIAVAADNFAKKYLQKTKKLMIYDSDSDVVKSIPDNNTVEEEFDRKTDYETLRRNLEKLPERDKLVLALKYDLELDEKQMADALQIKKDSVRMTVSRSLSRLAQIYKNQKTTKESAK